MLIKHIMKSPAICIDEATTINDTINIMRKHKINFLPITKRDHLAGVVTDRDILFRSQHLNKNTKISKIMTQNFICTINQNASVEIANKTMDTYKVTKLVVIHDDYIKGIITMKDIYEYLKTNNHNSNHIPTYQKKDPIN